jgi:predicted DsbA family dithiol-disulfide isomerase
MLTASRTELARIRGLDDEQVDYLVRNGFQSAQEVADAQVEDIADVLGLDEAAARAVVESADALVEALIREEAERRRGGGDEASTD